jgi:hypothetical protein
VTALIQNFSVPADNDVEVVLRVTPDLEMASLAGTTIYWRVYPQEFGIPIFDAVPSGSVAALIEKSTSDGSIALLPSPPPMSCEIRIKGADTSGLLRNYYHETTLIDGAGNISTLNCGIMTVTATLNR